MVYFIQQSKHGPIKIGKANNPRSRMRDLQIGNPDKLYLLVAVGEHHATEPELHEHFASLRMYGEWFKPGKKLLRYISEMKTIDKPRRVVGDGASVECRMCGLEYVKNIGNDRAIHRKRHDAIRGISLPSLLLEYLKDWGAYIARYGKVGSFKGKTCAPEIGKRILALALWMDSTDRLTNPANFEQFMADRLDKLDEEN